jgi:hypothetical protein
MNDELPEGYWEALMEAMKKMKPLPPEPEYEDPEPFV